MWENLRSHIIQSSKVEVKQSEKQFFLEGAVNTGLNILIWRSIILFFIKTKLFYWGLGWKTSMKKQGMIRNLCSRFIQKVKGYVQSARMSCCAATWFNYWNKRTCKTRKKKKTLMRFWHGKRLSRVTRLSLWARHGLPLCGCSLQRHCRLTAAEHGNKTTVSAVRAVVDSLKCCGR